MVAKEVTLLNRLPRKDSPTGLDTWYKKVLYDVAFTVEEVRTVQGTTVSIGQVYTILIPFSDKFLPYKEWKDGKMDSHYTMSTGDIIILGTQVEEDVTPNNIQLIRNEYEPNVCEVKSVLMVEDRLGVKYQLKVGGI